MIDRTKLQKFVWMEFKYMEIAGLGTANESLPSRDKFQVRESILRKVTNREIKEGASFIRSDKTHGLLFRATSQFFENKIPKELLLLAKEHKHGGIEFRWKDLNGKEYIIKELFDIVKSCSN